MLDLPALAREWDELMDRSTVPEDQIFSVLRDQSISRFARHNVRALLDAAAKWQQHLDAAHCVHCGALSKDLDPATHWSECPDHPAREKWERARGLLEKARHDWKQYKDCYEQFGGGNLNTGRAWDLMNRTDKKIAALLGEEDQDGRDEN